MRGYTSWVLTPADWLSFVRVPLGVAFVPLAGRPTLALLVLGLAGISDMLDGWLARRKPHPNSWGPWLDPLCDKVFITLVLIGLYLSQAPSLSTTLALLTARGGHSPALHCPLLDAFDTRHALRLPRARGGQGQHRGTVPHRGGAAACTDRKHAFSRPHVQCWVCYALSPTAGEVMPWPTPSAHGMAALLDPLRASPCAGSAVRGSRRSRGCPGSRQACPSRGWRIRVPAGRSGRSQADSRTAEGVLGSPPPSAPGVRAQRSGWQEAGGRPHRHETSAPPPVSPGRAGTHRPRFPLGTTQSGDTWPKLASGWPRISGFAS